MGTSVRTKRPVTIVLLLMVALLVTTMVASAAATPKQLSTNYTLVNLATTSNNANIRFYTATGAQWRTPKNVTLPNQGSQFIDRQYFDNDLPGGAGSVVVGGTGELGAVVQIQARNQTPTSGAYSGAAAGASSVSIPLVAKNLPSASGTLNSQVIVQNTGTGGTSATINIINAAGQTVRQFPIASLAVGAANTYDVTSDSQLGNGQFSAVVTAGAGGSITAVSNLFMGPDGMQTFSGFTSGAQKWVAPLFTSRLGNGLSTPVTIQNISGGTIPAGGISMSCVANAGSTIQTPISNVTNPDPVANTASYSFNPVVDSARFPTDWQGACTITTSASTIAFVQMRFVGTGNVAAYEAIRGDSTKTKVIVPLYLKQLSNNFATAVTIANLGTQAATVDVQYIASSETPRAECSGLLQNQSIPIGGSLVQNHRISSGPNSVPSIGANCQGSMVVTSKNGQPIDAFVQITVIGSTNGDTFMAHDAFPVAQ